MKTRHIERRDGLTGPIIGVYGCPQAFPTVDVTLPDDAEVGWDDAGGQWAPGAELVAAQQAKVTRESKRAALAQKVATLRQWSQDAAGLVGQWDGLANGQRYAAMKVVVERLGIFFDHAADLIETR